MNISFAPMEGLTTCFYRRLHHEFFPYVDKYYTPFISVYAGQTIKKRDEREIDLKINEGMNLVPQVLTNDADDFVWIYKKLSDMGYNEINLNLGCPSGTVSAKMRGSGFLRDTEKLDEFFDEVYSKLPKAMNISVKTRIGYNDASEIDGLMDIYNKYPLKELTVHPRVRKQFYKGEPDIDAFDIAFKKSKCCVVYNGNIMNIDDYKYIIERYHDSSNYDMKAYDSNSREDININANNNDSENQDIVRPNEKLCAIMLGRGMVSNPALCREVRGLGALQKDEMKDFVTDLKKLYKQELATDRNVLAKMKEVWSYMSKSFEGSDKLLKSILKSKSLEELSSYERVILSSLQIKRLENGLSYKN